MTNAVYAMMTAWGLRAAAVMSKQQTIALLAVNGAATLACLACLWRDACAPRLPPAALALDRAATAHGAALVVDWVTVSRQARAAAIKCLAWRPRAVAPIHVVEERLADARGAWVEAKRRDCLFEATLRESMDALLPPKYANGVLPSEKRHHDHELAPRPARAPPGGCSFYGLKSAGRAAVWNSTTGLGGPDQTSEFSSSVKSKSIRLVFGRIDCSHRVLEAKPKKLRRNIRVRSH